MTRGVWPYGDGEKRGQEREERGWVVSDGVGRGSFGGTEGAGVTVFGRERISP